MHEEILKEIKKDPEAEKALADFIENGSKLMQHLSADKFLVKEVYDFLYNTMLNEV